MTDRDAPTDPAAEEEAPRDEIEAARAALLDAALIHVAFDGWSAKTLRAATLESEVDPALARIAAPRGAIDLAIAFHDRADHQLAADLSATDLTGLRYRDRVAYAVRRRFELVAAHREVVRRSTSLFALPMHAMDGSRALWRTADTIWRALGDDSQDYNWYTKRMTLSGVLSATLLYWLGDESPGAVRTREFVDRRIDDVMQIEKLRSQMTENPLGRALMTGPNWLLGRIRPPSARTDMPGYVPPR
ncbi:MAG: COQ9 family protein [Pseudomonadota bacterium]